jgi:purine nucleosidase
VGVDPEAAAIVAESGIDTVWVTWDTSRGDTEITPAELDALAACGDEAGRFCARCIRDMQAWQRRMYGRDSIGVIDAMLMTAALYPEVMEDVFRARCSVELAPGEYRGFFRMDRDGEPKAAVCPRIDAGAYKKKLFALLGLR